MIPSGAAAPPRAAAVKRHSIPRRGAQPAEESFERLRAEGIRLLQKLSGTTWTDHNLHDPGITILEQMCYALTDLVYRADFPVADHLTGADGRIAFDALALQPPNEAFPCRATTASDQRRWLLDNVDGLDDAMLVPVASGDAAPDGLYRMVLELSQGMASADDARIVLARQAYRAQRNLCEDLDGDVVLVRERLCELHADVEIGGPREGADLQAEIYDRCARHIAQSVRLHNLREELADGRTLEQIYTGPATQHGFLDRRDLEARPHELLFVGELAEQIMKIDGVKELRRLALHLGGETVVGSLPWYGDDWVLRLQVPATDGPARAGHVNLTRRGHAVPVDPADLQLRYRDRRTAGRTSRVHLKNSQGADAASALPHGQQHDLAHYLSVQEQFPAVYGLGRRGLPASAAPERRAQVEQLKAYLALFEQVMAHSAEQLQHLRELFSGQLVPRRSYWWQVLGDDQVPGIEALYRQPPATIEASACAPLDPFGDRKGRVLDHLLALYGETWSQDSVRQFLGHVDNDEADRLLLQVKAALLRQVATHGRDRTGAFDDGKPSWDRADNTSGLQRRLNLLLGFRHPHSRPLTQALRQQNRRLVEGHDEPVPLAAELAASTMAPSRPREQHPREQMTADLLRMPPLRGTGLGTALFRAGTRRERYRLVPPRSGRGPWQLLLLSDTPRRGWPLAEAANEAEAVRMAGHLRRLLLHLNHESEGLHLVEHTLLRPIGRSGMARRLAVPPDFHALRVSVVLPDWSVRTHEPNFRRFAEDTVRINCPAHVAARCLWLDFDRMQTFETRWQTWLQARIEHCAATDASGDIDERLEQAACEVIECLLGDSAFDPGSGLQGHA